MSTNKPSGRDPERSPTPSDYPEQDGVGKKLYNNMIYLCCRIVNWGQAKMSNLGFDKNIRASFDYPCYSCYNVMDSESCQVAFFNNVVSKKASEHGN